MREFILSIPFILILSITLSAVLYLIGGLISPKVEKIAAKFSSYACGEDLPSRKLQVNAEEFFIYATYFLVFDVLAFMLATSLGKPGFFPILFIIIVFIASLMLSSVRGKEEKWA